MEPTPPELNCQRRSRQSVPVPPQPNRHRLDHKHNKKRKSKCFINQFSSVMQPIVNGYTDFQTHLSDTDVNGNDDGDGDDHKRALLDKLLYSTTRRLLIISQIFLSAPTGVDKPKTLLVRRKERLLFRLHLIWSIGIYIVLALCVYHEYTSSNVELPTVQKPLYISEYVVYLAHMLEIIFASHMGHENYWIFHDFFIDFDRKLLDLKLPINYMDLGAFIHTHMCLVVLYFIFSIIICYFYTAGIWLKVFRSNIVYTLPNIVIQLSLIHYYALLFMTATRSDKLYHLLYNLLLKSDTLDMWTLRTQLHVLRNLYAQLEQFTRDVNDAFSYAIILVYFGSFMNICVNIFLLYKFFNAWNKSEVAINLFSAGWVCMHIGKMFLILYYNEGIQNKKAKAAVLLSTFRNKNVAVEPTVTYFILQLISDTRSNVICGLAPLNMNFITSLLVAISTLFIFLVQYDITFEALSITHSTGKPNMKQY